MRIVSNLLYHLFVVYCFVNIYEKSLTWAGDVNPLGQIWFTTSSSYDDEVLVNVSLDFLEHVLWKKLLKRNGSKLFPLSNLFQGWILKRISMLLECVSKT